MLHANIGGVELYYLVSGKPFDTFDPFDPFNKLRAGKLRAGKLPGTMPGTGRAGRLRTLRAVSN